MPRHPRGQSLVFTDFQASDLFIMGRMRRLMQQRWKLWGRGFQVEAYQEPLNDVAATGSFFLLLFFVDSRTAFRPICTYNTWS